MTTHASILPRTHVAAEGTSARLALAAGRIAFAIPFLVFGVQHFLNGPAMAGYVPLPGGVFWIYLTGAAMIAAAIALVTGKLARWAALGIAALMAVFVLTIHLPGLGAEATRQMSMMGLLKDVGLLGGALTWFGLLSRNDA